MLGIKLPITIRHLLQRVMSFKLFTTCISEFSGSYRIAPHQFTLPCKPGFQWRRTLRADQHAIDFMIDNRRQSSDGVDNNGQLDRPRFQQGDGKSF